jgi:hypothetical protein
MATPSPTISATLSPEDQSAAGLLRVTVALFTVTPLPPRPRRASSRLCSCRSSRTFPLRFLAQGGEQQAVLHSAGVNDHLFKLAWSRCHDPQRGHRVELITHQRD